jgi:hypothetical protein
MTRDIWLMRKAPCRTMKLLHPSCAAEARPRAEIDADPGRIDAQVTMIAGAITGALPTSLLQEHRPRASNR